MAVWSSLVSKNIRKLDVARRVFASLTKGIKNKGVNYVPVRNSHANTMVIRDSTYPALKFKDMMYFYITVGAVPLISIILYVNIFIGPATLAVIPEGYEPEPWEYYRHPITRYFAKITRSRQEIYERTLHSLFFDQEKKMLQQLENKVSKHMSDKEDYQAWYVKKPITKYARKMKEFSEEAEQRAGRSGGWIL